jgi:hypothetical protein
LNSSGGLAPDLPASDPGADDISLPVEYHQVGVRPMAECPLLILDPEAPTTISTEKRTGKKMQETHLAGLKVAHLMASPREHPVKREKFRTHLSSVTTLETSEFQKRKIKYIDLEARYLPASIVVPSRYSLSPSFTKRFPSRHSCMPSRKLGSKIFIAITTPRHK